MDNVMSHTNANYQEQAQYFEQVSPMNQETATIHHFPTPEYTSWNQTYQEYYDSMFVSTTTTPNEGEMYQHYGSYCPPSIHMEPIRCSCPTTYEIPWEPMPILGNTRNNQAMKQFMQRNSGGGCTIMQPAQRERVATPRSDYRQMLYPKFTENQYTSQECQQVQLDNSYNMVMTEEQYYSINAHPEMQHQVEGYGTGPQETYASNASIVGFHEDESQIICANLTMNQLSYDINDAPDANDTNADNQITYSNANRSDIETQSVKTQSSRDSQEARNMVVDHILTLEEDTVRDSSEPSDNV